MRIYIVSRSKACNKAVSTIFIMMVKNSSLALHDSLEHRHNVNQSYDSYFFVKVCGRELLRTENALLFVEEGQDRNGGALLVLTIDMGSGR